MKSVRFDTSLNVVHTTFSPDEYDRKTCNYAVKRKLRNEMSHEEWQRILQSLEYFKIHNMVVHSSSVSSVALLGLIQLNSASCGDEP